MSAELRPWRVGIRSSRTGIGWRNGHDYSGLWQERPTQIALLEEPKYGLNDDFEALQQLLASCYETYLRVNCGSQIVERRRA